MILKYEFETDFLGHNEEYNEDYFDTESYEYEIDDYQEKEVAIEMIKIDTGFNDENAEKVFDFLDNNDLLYDYLDAGREFIEDYFRDEAQEQFYEERRN